MVRIILIRPGSTDYDQQGRIQGNLDIPLNDQGNVEVHALAEQLRGEAMSVIYTSSGEPARQTAEEIAAVLSVKLKRLEQMHNLDHGLWQGMLVDDVRRKHPKVFRQWQEQPESVCPPEGEMLAQAEERIRPVLAKLLRRHRDGAIGLVVSEPLASVIRAAATHQALGDLWKASAERAWWEALEVSAEQILSPSS